MDVDSAMEPYVQALKLLLPALIPSWRFFDVIAPSPRIEFALLKARDDLACDWQEFRPRPAKLALSNMFARLFYNPRWNEYLFLVSCAERFTMHATAHSEQEIMNRIRTELARNAVDASWLQFRLAFVSREGADVRRHIVHVSPVFESAHA